MRLTLRAAFRNSLKQRVVVSDGAQEASGTHISTRLVTWPLTTMMHRCSVDGKRFKGFTSTGNKKVSKKLELNLLSSLNTFLMFYFDHFWNTMNLKVVQFSIGTIYHSWSSWSAMIFVSFPDDSGAESRNSAGNRNKNSSKQESAQSQVTWVLPLLFALCVWGHTVKPPTGGQRSRGGSRAPGLVLNAGHHHRRHVTYPVQQTDILL